MFVVCLFTQMGNFKFTLRGFYEAQNNHVHPRMSNDQCNHELRAFPYLVENIDFDLRTIEISFLVLGNI